MMNSKETKAALAAAVRAARAAGTVMRKNLHVAKTVNLANAHDIKLELDVQCQKLIEGILHRAFPEISFLGEEGEPRAKSAAALRWVVDPSDGTVNYAHGIPHAAVSIALQERVECQVASGARKRPTHHASRITNYVTLVGVIYDPFQDELWTAMRGAPARLNGRVIQVSRTTDLGEAMVTMGFVKNRANLRAFVPYFMLLSRRVRKVRMFGSAALALAYVAMGRFDAYIERRLNLWDFAAGGLIIECAGGEFQCQPVPGYLKHRILASNGRLKPTLPPPT